MHLINLYMISGWKIWARKDKDSPGATTVGADRVYEILDRVLINSRWVTQFPNSQCINEVVVGSDHSPIILTTRMEVHRSIRGFRFEEMWPESPECKDVIRTTWSKSSNRRENRTTLCPKLGMCRRSLMKWSKERFDNNMVKMWKAKQRLQKI